MIGFLFVIVGELANQSMNKVHFIHFQFIFPIKILENIDIVQHHLIA